MNDLQKVALAYTQIKFKSAMENGEITEETEPEYAAELDYFLSTYERAVKYYTQNYKDSFK